MIKEQTQMFIQRKVRGFEQKQMAKLLGVTEKTYGRWERGEVVPPFDKLEQICIHLNIDFGLMCKELLELGKAR